MKTKIKEKKVPTLENRKLYGRLAESTKSKILKEISDGLISQLKSGSKMNLKFQLRYDKVGKQYAWIEFLFAKANKGFKVVVAGDVLRLIEEYAVGSIKVGFTAEELSEVALNG